MNQPVETKNLSKALSVMTHAAAVLVIGYPAILLVLAAVQNPDYFSRLIIPDPKNGFLGTAVFLLMLVFLGLGYGAVVLIANTLIALASGKFGRAQIAFGLLKTGILGVGVYFAITAALVCGLLGPAGLILFESPVGQMFFGG